MQNVEPIYEGQFHFDPEDPIYADHFPGRPVVPGSLIISAFMTAARPAMERQREYFVENFRFRRFISPGRYAFRIQSKADGCVQCSLYDSGSTVVTGTLREQVPCP
jgi:3-hydroxyacyl-[acyl-carrier-protein] dehydratase